MASLEDLEKEVRALRQRLGRVEGNPDAENDQAVSELVADDSDQPVRTGFANAVQGMNAQDSRRRMDEGRRYLAENPQIVNTTAPVARLLKELPGRLTISEGQQIVAEFRNKS